jgi:hypothetical protein
VNPDGSNPDSSDGGGDAPGTVDTGSDGPQFPARPLGQGMGAYAIVPSGAHASPQLWTRSFSGPSPTWQVLYDVPNAVSPPTSVSWTRMRTDVFYTTKAGTLAHTHTGDFGQTYGPLDDWGAPSGHKLVGRPDATSWGEGRIDVVCLAQPVAGGPQTVAHAGYDAQSVVWEDWGWPATDAGSMTPQSNATILAWSLGRLDVLVVGTDGQLWHKFLDGMTSATPSDWGVFSNDGFGLGFDLDGVSPEYYQLDVFTTGSAGQLLHWHWYPPAWETWSGPVADGGLAAQLGPASLARTGTDGWEIGAVDSNSPPTIWLKSFRYNAPSGWASIEAPPAMPPRGIVEVTAW